jgi:hypothetical protein
VDVLARTYAHVIAELDGQPAISAENAIRPARERGKQGRIH